MASTPTAADVIAARTAAAHPLPEAMALVPHLPALLAEADWSAGVVEEGGQSHRVLVLDGVGAVRLPRTPEAAALLPDRMAAVALLAGFGGTTPALAVPVPVPLTRVVGEAEGLPAGTAAAVQAYLPGQPHPPHEGDPEVLRGLCEALAAVDVEPLRPHLAGPFAYAGPWTPERVDSVRRLPQLLAERGGAGLWDGPWIEEHPVVRAAEFGAAAERLLTAVTEWTDHPPVPPSLVHGDLAGHNMRWLRRPAPDGAGSDGAGSDGAHHWELAGILDWDLAAAWDPALNAAYLALWHGEEKLEAIARDPEEAVRARVWLGWMALETLSHAATREAPGHPDGTPNWAKLLRKVLPRIGRAHAALDS